jgi:hypothetical protein
LAKWAENAVFAFEQSLRECFKARFVSGTRFVSGHDFSRAEKDIKKLGFSP